jgi:pimeloyl-ACP methyl ester carboxylesterase
MNVFGQRIHWSETGNGPPVILLHGLGSDSSEWTRVAGFLSARNRRVITLDQIGFGQSGKPALRYRTETMVSFLEGFCEALRLERTSLVAHGAAGAVAIQFAAQHPQVVERLVLANTGFLMNATAIELLNPATRSEARDLQKRTRFETSDWEADQIWADSMVSACANQALIDAAASDAVLSSAALPQLTTPSLVIWGREDRLTPLETGEKIYAAIPNSQMVIIEKAGHAPHREQPAEFSAIVDKFLSGAKVHQKFRKQRQEENVLF